MTKSNPKTHHILAVTEYEFVEIVHALMNAGRFDIARAIRHRAGLEPINYSGEKS
jgi:hypothetical protein